MATDWHLIGIVKSSVYREATLLALDTKKTPSDLHQALPKISRPHLSRSLRELTKLRLVTCLTPKTPRYRLYQRTKQGNTIAKALIKLRDVK